MFCATSPQPMPAALLDAMLEAACLVDAEQRRVVAANPAAGRLWACAASDLVGRSMDELACTPEDLLFWSQSAHWPRDGAALHSDSLVQRADGSLGEVERRVTAVDLPDGRPGWLLTLIDQTGRRDAEREVERLLGELGATMASSREAILVTDLEGRVRSWNPPFARLWRLPARLDVRHEGGRIERSILAAMDDPTAYAERLGHRKDSLVKARRPAWPGVPGHGHAAPPLATDIIETRDGRTLERRLLPQYARGEVVGWVQVWHDQTQQRADQARLQMAAQVFDNILDAVFVTAADGRILAANPAAERLSGCSASALQGTALAPLLRNADGSGLTPARLNPGVRTPRWEGELQLATPDGPAPVQATLVRGTGQGALAGGCILVLRDQRERKAAERQLLELAHTDALTGLANRAGLMERLDREATVCAEQQAAVTATGHPAPTFALLLIGLDRFKHVNDSLGHSGGDQVLCEAGRRLNDSLRLGDQVARLGGDLFAVMLPGSDAATTEAVARRLLNALQHDLVAGDLRLALSASIGVAMFPCDGSNAAELLEHADRAMHRVKERHGGDVRFYQPQMHVDRLDHIRLDRAMRHGLAQGDFHLEYQPQIDLASGAVIGAEVLCRWTDPDLGVITPARFIPVAEETGFITELGDWVLREAVTQAARWQSQGRPMPVSVNVSILQFQQSHFVNRVAQVLQSTGLAPELLELELTESILVGDVEAMLLQLRSLAALGVRLAIDDFGTGYSSLGYLKRLPIHRLKIDRSFIQRLPDDASDVAITRTIVELGRALHLRVIAEGVETEAQRAHLASLGCDEYQGWLYAPALPVVDFERLLSERASPDAPRPESAWATLAA